MTLIPKPPDQDQRLSGSAVLVRLPSSSSSGELSSFESAVLSFIDGVRDNTALAAAVGVGVGDLRIALGALLHKGLIGSPPLRPAVQVATRAPPGTASTPPLTSPPSTPSPLVHDDRHGAAALHARCLRELRRGDAAGARALAELAAQMAPQTALHQTTLSGWDELVAKHLGLEVAGAARVDLVRCYVADHASSAGGFSLLAQLLDDDPAAAAAAATRAAALAPTSIALRRQAHDLGAIAARAGRLGRLKALFTPAKAPVKSAARRR